MRVRPLRPVRHLLGALLLLVFGSLALGVRAEEQQTAAANQQQIAEVEKQIEALNKQLAELKKTNGGAGAAAAAASAAPEAALNPEWVKALTWRSIGPASMGGRITAIAVCETDPSTYWIATASGGLLKTENNGNTFVHQFEKENTVSIGDVAVAPSDKNVVWVGTGEANPRNSVSYGDGVYKSTDGGKTWKHVGLKKTFQIGRIAIHPKDPSIVYVGALGRLYGPNPERGLFKTTNGGETWEKVLFVDDKTGVIDVKISPADPETVLVATYERQRDGFDTYIGEPPQPGGYDAYDPIKKWGPGSGIYKTTDGGKSFRKLTNGLPSCQMGRIGLDVYRKDPKTLFAIIETEKIGMGPPPSANTEPYMGLVGEDADAGAKIKEVLSGTPADKAGLKVGDIILTVEGKTILSYNQFLEQIKGRKVGDKVKLTVSRNRSAKDVELVLGTRPPERMAGGAGRNTRPYNFMYSGQQPNVQDRQGQDGKEYGGVYKSTDAGETWTRLNSVNPRPMYFSAVRVDPSDDKYLYVLGISLYASQDGGKTFRPYGNNALHPDQHTLWIDPKDGRHMIVGCDGGFYSTYDRMANWDHLNTMAIGQFYHVTVDSKKPYRVYGGLQDNASWGGPSLVFSGAGPINEDWVTLLGGDGFVCRVDPNDPDLIYCEFQDGNMLRRNVRTGEMAPIRPRPQQPPLVFDWTKPLLPPLWGGLVAPPLPSTKPTQPPYHFNWNTPFILSSHNPRIFYAGGNYVFRSLKQGDDLRPISPVIGRTSRGTATALAESPRNPDVLYAGTDDGALWVTRDGGAKWTRIGENMPGLPGPRWVASIEASRFADGRAYVVLDAHRSDDDEPYAYVTEDYGQTWKSLRANLPWGSTRVLREDVQNPNLLYLGTEFACWASVNRGGSWVKINNNLPTVAVHEVAVHPTAGEIVAATHGRSLWVLDVTPLRQMTAEALKSDAFLYEPNTVVRWRSEPNRGSMYGSGSRRFVGQNPPRGAQIYYHLNKKAEKVSLKVLDFSGKTMRELSARTEPGLHKAVWDLSRSNPDPRPAGQRQGGPGGLFLASQAAPGTYRIVLTVDGKEYSQGVHIEADPTVPTFIAAPEDEFDPERRERAEEKERDKAIRKDR